MSGPAAPVTAGATRWDARLAEAVSPPPLLQSWGWGEVQAGSGWAVERVDLGAAIASVQIRGGRRPLGYVPRGPVPATPAALGKLSGWARDRRLAALRIEPEAGPDLQPALRELGFRPTGEIQPSRTLIVDLDAEEALLASFRPKGRYNVRLAARRGVEVEAGQDAAELARQAAATAGRQGISLPGAGHYARILELLPSSRTYIARIGEEAVAGILVAEHGGRAYYLFGGSSGRHRELMPNHALQFQAMLGAQERGCRDYDLWGLPPAADPGHPWFGLWQFKTGFGGRRVEYAGAWELVIDPLAAAALAGRDRLRRLSRRLRG